jgi:hypothetical protein
MKLIPAITLIYGLLWAAIPSAEATVWNCRFSEEEQSAYETEPGVIDVNAAFYVCDTFGRNNTVMVKVIHVEKIGGRHYFDVLQLGQPRPTLEFSLQDLNEGSVTVNGVLPYWQEIGPDFTRRIGHDTDYLSPRRY